MPNVVRMMRRNASPEALEGVWKRSFPDQIPEKLVFAEEAETSSILKGARWSRRNLVTRILMPRPACTSVLWDLSSLAMLALYPNRVNPGWALWSSARAVERGT